MVGDAREASTNLDAAAGRLGGARAWTGARRREPRGTPLLDACRPTNDDRPDLRPGRRRRQPRPRGRRPDAHRRRRPARRAVQGLARAGSTASTASTASPAWATRSPAAGARKMRQRPTRRRDGRRRLVSADELRHLLVGVDRPQADRRRVRQRRLRGDQPPADRQGWRGLQQPDRRLPGRAALPRSTSPPTPARWAATRRVHRDRRPRRGARPARATDRTTVISIDTDAYGWTPDDAGWEVGVPEVSARAEVLAAAAQWQQGRAKQRRGV